MNPVKISQSLKQMLVDYLATIFDVNKDGKEPELAKKIRESLEAPRSLSTGPFLELIYPYSTQSSIRELSEKGILSSLIKSAVSIQLPTGQRNHKLKMLYY